jgi:hypothetical protein
LAEPATGFLFGWVFWGFGIASVMIATGVLFAIAMFVISCFGMRDF